MKEHPISPIYLVIFYREVQQKYEMAAVRKCMYRDWPIGWLKKFIFVEPAVNVAHCVFLRAALRTEDCELLI